MATFNCKKCNKDGTTVWCGECCPDGALKDAAIALYDAANAIYDAGYWTCDKECGKEEELWEALRDALGREPGTGPGKVDISMGGS